MFGVGPSGDDAPPPVDADSDPDAIVEDAPPRCDAWFDAENYIDSQGVPNATAARAGNFNGDSHTDLVLVSNSQSGVSIVHSSPDGTFADLMSAGGRVGTSVAVGDVDGDQDDDIAMGTSNGYVAVLSVQGAAFSEVEVQAGTGAVYPAFVRWPGDNTLDLAVAKSSTNQVQIYTQTAGTLGFSTGPQFATGGQPSAIAAGNLDASNAFGEIVTANKGGASISMIQELPVGGQFAVQDYPVGDQPLALAFGHVDQDNLLDLVIAKRFEQIEVIRGDASGSFGLLHVVVPQAKLDAIEVGDIDGDGLGEIVTLGLETGVVHVIRDSTTTMDPDAQTTYPAPNDTVTLALGDFFGGDGHLDLALVRATGQIRVYPNCR